MIGDVLNLAALCLRLGRVDRATRHEDGSRPETDTDHTVMLGIVACAYAARCAPCLDLGKVAQFSLVHDLVEAYSGDVMSLGMDASARDAKERAEAEALERIRVEFAALPWVAATIDEYESLASDEARFVKIVDKALPKLTHLLNGGSALAEHGFSTERAHRGHMEQRQMMVREYPQADALALFDSVIGACAPEWGVG